MVSRSPEHVADNIDSRETTLDALVESRQHSGKSLRPVSMARLDCRYSSGYCQCHVLGCCRRHPGHLYGYVASYSNAERTQRVHAIAGNGLRETSRLLHVKRSSV